MKFQLLFLNIIFIFQFIIIINSDKEAPSFYKYLKENAHYTIPTPLIFGAIYFSINWLKKIK